jgi:AcrR family transcriptional regulator
MGRPREHDERTAAALLAAAERAVQDGGIDALSVRGVAADVGTTTRAVYSVYGSKDGLVAALAARPFELLRDGLESVPVTDDPAADLVAAALMYRRFSKEHPSLWALGMQYVGSDTVRMVAWESLNLLKERVGRLAEAEGLHGRTVDQATLQFHALCEGMAAVELRGRPEVSDWEAMWRQAFAALVAGFAS